MECPHLDTWIIPISQAKLTVCKHAGKAYGTSYYSPTVFQVKQFCRKEEYPRCPFYHNGMDNYLGEIPLHNVAPRQKR